MRYLAYVFWGFIVFLGILFAALNSSNLEIHYYFGSFKIYLPLLLVLQLLLGAVIGVCAMLPWMIKAQHTQRKLRGRIKQIEQEVRNLRVIPIQDVH